MKIVKRATQLVALGACMVAVSPAALAKAPSGFYLGGSLGKSTYDISKQDFDEITRDAFSSQGRQVVSMTSSLEDGDSSFALIAGYRFLPYVAVEVSYLDLGTAEYRSTETIRPFGFGATQNATLNFDMHTTGVTVAGIGSIPIGDVFDLHGRLGLFVNNTEMEATAVVNTTGVGTETLTSAGPLFGIGAAFHIGNHFSLSLDWTRYANIGDENEDEDFGTTEGFDADALSVSAVFTF